MLKIFRTKPALAKEIAKIENGILYFTDGTEARPIIGDEYICRFNPAVGGYYLQYLMPEDGRYETYLPGEVLGIELPGEGENSTEGNPPKGESSKVAQNDTQPKKGKRTTKVTTQPVNTKPEVVETSSDSKSDTVSHGELFQLHWINPKDLKQTVFIAQASTTDFTSEEAQKDWIKEMFAKSLESRPDEDWQTMVCTESSDHFVWAAPKANDGQVSAETA